MCDLFNRTCCSTLIRTISGPIGPRGATGPTGATGATGLSLTANSAFAANTTGPEISVVPDGTNISLPNNQILTSDITIDAANEILTVATAGKYLIEYNINLASAVIVGSRVLINGISYTPSQIPPLLMQSNYRNSFIVNLSAGSTVALQLYGLAAAVTLQNGGGANVSIIRLA